MSWYPTSNNKKKKTDVIVQKAPAVSHYSQRFSQNSGLSACILFSVSNGTTWIFFHGAHYDSKCERWCNQKLMYLYLRSSAWMALDGFLVCFSVCQPGAAILASSSWEVGYSLINLLFIVLPAVVRRIKSCLEMVLLPLHEFLKSPLSSSDISHLLCSLWIGWKLLRN